MLLHKSRLDSSRSRAKTWSIQYKQRISVVLSTLETGLTISFSRTLATTPYLVDHIPTPSKTQALSTDGPISSLNPSLPPPPLHSACTHHFLHPVSWMRPALEQGLLSGRLECPNPKCGGQLGRYAWQGMRCSCGVWVCPAFSLQKGRVDEVTKKIEHGVSKSGNVGDRAEIGTGHGIRLPPGMKGKENL